MALGYQREPDGCSVKQQDSQGSTYVDPCELLTSLVDQLGIAGGGCITDVWVLFGLTL